MDNPLQLGVALVVYFAGAGFCISGFIQNKPINYPRVLWGGVGIYSIVKLIGACAEFTLFFTKQ